MDIKKGIKKITGKYNGIPLIAAGIIIVSMIISGLGNKETKNSKPVDGISINDNEAHSIDPEPDDDTLSIFGIKEINIDEGSTKAELYYLNPEQNADKYYIVVSIYLKDTNELLYSSDLLPPGRVIDSAEFTRSFKKGRYDACFRVEGYKMNDFSSVKGADLDIVINVN